MGKGKERSLGPKIGHDLRKACLVAKCKAIKIGTKERKEDHGSFKNLMESECTDLVSSRTLRELHD